jgi:hypothetical protein
MAGSEGSEYFHYGINGSLKLRHWDEFDSEVKKVFLVM